MRRFVLHLSSWMPWLAACLMLAAQPVSAGEYRSFDSDGVMLSYTERGSGVPVILLHGFDGDFERLLTPLAQHLSRHYRVIGFDQRGHGRSGKPHDANAYGAQLAKDVLNLMDHLHLDKAHVIGHSMGGIVAVYLAAHHPQRLYSITTIGNGLFTAGELDLIGWLMRGKFAWAHLKQAFGSVDTSHSPTRDETALILVVRSLGALAVTPAQASALRLPVFAARGGPEDDPRNTVERFATRNPAIKTLRLESEDHLSMVSSAAFLDALDAFLAQSPAR